MAKRRADGTVIPTGGKDNKEYKKGDKKKFNDKKKGKSGMKWLRMTMKNRIF